MAAPFPPIVHHPAFRAEMPAGHRFPMDKFSRLASVLEAQGVPGPEGFHRPEFIDVETLRLAHTEEYVRGVIELSLPAEVVRRIGMPNTDSVATRARAATGGTLLAERLALEHGIACNTAGGSHHASADSGAGFCVFNDCGVAIEILRQRFGVKRVAYIDIDAHHGDGVFYGFESDPDLIFADLHEDGRYLYPGTGRAEETGGGDARGTKLNIPMPPGADDDEFRRAWEKVETYLRAARPEFLLLQCGADSLEGDPITHMRYTEEAHAYAARRLCEIADEHAEGRIVATGGGGYNRRNLARAWTRVVQSFVESEEPASA